MATDPQDPTVPSDNSRGAAPTLDTPFPINPMQLFAAMLDAARSGCTCKPCGVLREAADSLSAKLLANPSGGATT